MGYPDCYAPGISRNPESPLPPMQPMSAKRQRPVGAVILNYNGWQDTICCAESLLAGSVKPDWLIIVDNASTDSSGTRLREWASGQLTLRVPGRDPELELQTHLDIGWNDAPGFCRLLELSQNRGYAAGNNAAIRHLLAWGAQAVWILNNDTVVHKNSLEKMRDRLFSARRPGLCGSLVCYADNADLVQCRAGGRTNRWTALARLNGHLESRHARASVSEVEKSIDFIYGASVMASRAFLEEVGLMDEGFFLYCEEQDWAWRGAGRFDLSYAEDALVWHKEGASTGFSHASFNAGRAWRLARSRLRLACKHAPWTVPTVCCGLAWAALRKILQRPANMA